MMFEKDNTNFNGECLCKSCKWGAPVYNRLEGKLTGRYLCVLEAKEYKQVGVCKDYVQFYEER